MMQPDPLSTSRAETQTESSLIAANRQFAEGSLTPELLVEAYLARIATDRLNSYAHVNAEGARRAAAESTARWMSGKPLSAIDGVPISVKDTLPVMGLPSRSGSLVTSGLPSKTSAPVVERLVNAGAVILGTTTTAEFGSALVTRCPLTGVTRNACDPRRTAGGSSGGAAVSVAAGLCAGAIATDAAGSIRIPSSFNGVVGLKPTGGRLPGNPASAISTLGTSGPIGRSVEDCSILFRAMSDQRFGNQSFMEPELRLGEVVDLVSVRFVASKSFGYTRYLDPEVESAFDQAIERIRAAGATVQEIEPDLDDPLPILRTIICANYGSLLETLTSDQVELLSDSLRDARKLGLGLRSNELLAAQVERVAFTARMFAAFSPYDVILSPTVAVPAFEVERFSPSVPPNGGADDWSAWSPFTYAFNLTTQPALTIPCGNTRDGLPLGLQLASQPGTEAFLLSLGMALERLIREK